MLEVAASGRSKGSVSRMLSADLIGGARSAARTDRIDTAGPCAGSIPGRRSLDRCQLHGGRRTHGPPSAKRLPSRTRSLPNCRRPTSSSIGMPVYNFGIPAALKAWVDMITRARLTFRYTENGPEGLLKGKKAYIVLASGGVPVDSPVDFATPYMRHALSVYRYRRYRGDCGRPAHDARMPTTRSTRPAPESPNSFTRSRPSMVVLPDHRDRGEDQ